MLCDGFSAAPDSALTGLMEKILDGGFQKSRFGCVSTGWLCRRPPGSALQEVAVATAPIDLPIE